jgi:glycosyltransferase involved in cell wall biosynthesis
MHVLLFLSDLDGGGAQRTVVNLANGLSQFGVETTLVVARSGGAAQNWLGSDVRLVSLDATRTRYALIGLRRELRRSCPNVLFATIVDANIVAALASIGLRKGMRVILRETNSHRARGDIRGVRRALIGWAYRGADAVVALSSGVRQELLDDYSLLEHKVVTIGNPVNIEALRRARNTEAANPLCFDRKGCESVLIAVGRLTRQKGFDLLIRAFAKLTLPSKLVILGEGPERDALRSLAQAEGVSDRISMPGFVADPSVWIRYADVFVLSSRWEGFGHVIVEAMAVGVPVVATDCPYGPADIVFHERNGLLVEPDNVFALKAGIELAIADKSESMKRVAIAKVDALRFESRSIVRKYLKIFSFS